MNKEYDPSKCPQCGEWVPEAHQLPGTACQGTCTSYLVVVFKGQKKDQLKWHHPLECEELEPEYLPCQHCVIYRPGDPQAQA